MRLQEQMFFLSSSFYFEAPPLNRIVLKGGASLVNQIDKWLDI